MSPNRWAIKVIWQDGEEEFLREGMSPNGKIALFSSRKRAEQQRDFMLEGIDREMLQSINIVSYDDIYG